jgi:hypothetical protein
MMNNAEITINIPAGRFMVWSVRNTVSFTMIKYSCSKPNVKQPIQRSRWKN